MLPPSTADSSRAAAVCCRNVCVSFGPTAALDNVSVRFPVGSIHAVVGQNGAGKTTLARVIAGIVRPERGSLSVNGNPISFGSVAMSRSAGVELVHQSFALPPSFSVAEAIEFGAGGGIGFFSRRQLIRRCKDHLDALRIAVDPARRIRDLAIEERQAVEIARALARQARILILDEPTAVLPPSGISSLFQRLKRLKAAGVTVLLILHKTKEIWAAADTVTVLRDGRVAAANLDIRETDPDRVGELIMGSPVMPCSTEMAEKAAIKDRRRSPPAVQLSEGGRSSALELKSVSTADNAKSACLDNVSLSVMPGEIVGIAGVEGNGQVPLLQAVAGLSRVTSGDIWIAGRPARDLGLARRRSLGLRIIPFDRNSEGLSLTSSLWENWAAGKLASGPLLKLISPAGLRERSSDSMSRWDVRRASPDQRAGSLSGGNCQKLILSREFDGGARMIVAAQPTRGLDIGATAFVWSALREASSQGSGVLLISSDIDELFDISHRLLVMLSGRIVCTLNPPFDRGRAGRAMVGAA